MQPITSHDSTSVMNEAENCVEQGWPWKLGQLQPAEGQCHRLLDHGFNSQNHSSCFSEGPADAQVLFKGMCQRRCFLACHSAPQEYTLQRMVVVNKDYKGKWVWNLNSSLNSSLTKLKAIQTVWKYVQKMKCILV